MIDQPHDDGFYLFDAEPDGEAFYLDPAEHPQSVFDALRAEARAADVLRDQAAAEQRVIEEGLPRVALPPCAKCGKAIEGADEVIVSKATEDSRSEIMHSACWTIQMRSVVSILSRRGGAKALGVNMLARPVA